MTAPDPGALAAAARSVAGTAAALGVPLYWAPARVLHDLAAGAMDDPYPDADEGARLAASDDPALWLERRGGRWLLA